MVLSYSIVTSKSMIRYTNRAQMMSKSYSYRFKGSQQYTPSVPLKSWAQFYSLKHKLFKKHFNSVCHYLSHHYACTYAIFSFQRCRNKFVLCFNIWSYPALFRKKKTCCVRRNRAWNWHRSGSPTLNYCWSARHIWIQKRAALLECSLCHSWDFGRHIQTSTDAQRREDWIR